jgi:hypothetical protein
MLASSSGVSSERSAFMGLVKNEIERLNQEISARGALTMIFKRGNIKARPCWPLLPHQNVTHSALLLCMLLQGGVTAAHVLLRRGHVLGPTASQTFCDNVAGNFFFFSFSLWLIWLVASRMHLGRSLALCGGRECRHKCCYEAAQVGSSSQTYCSMQSSTQSYILTAR